MLQQNQGLAIGIDLGTTFSCVGVYHKGAVKIISNEDGNRITPSCVSFSDTGVLKGERAKQRLSMAPKNTVYEVKRIMGKSFDDPTVQADIRTWPFKVVSDGGKPKIQVKQQGVTKKLAPEEISAMVLTNMKELAEKYLEAPVTKAVVTVPAYFNDNQRQATENAARIAGLDVLRIINEPTAAALAYYDEGDFPTGKNVLVFDIGGGTFDVSVLKFEQGLIEVVATNGDTHLGGADFDDRMVKTALDYFNDTQANERVKNDPQSGKVIRLRSECERAKCRLSKRTMVEITIEDFHEGNDLIYPFNRETFEELNKEDFKKTIQLLDDALTDAKLGRDEIHDIVLVGGSSRIPKLQSLVQTYFNNKTLNKSINADEAVAYGAALQAAVLNGEQGSRVKELLLLDVTPLSLGIEIKGGLMSTIVKRNTLIPSSRQETYVTSEDNQTVASIKIFQGERKMVTDNQEIGHFHLEGIPPAPAGVSKLDVTIEISTNGTIFVVAIDKTTGKEKHLSIRNDRVRNTQDEVKRMIDEAWSYRTRDESECERVKAKNDLETYTNWMKYITEEFSTKLRLTDQKQKIAKTAKWLQDHQEGRMEDFKQRKAELEQAFQSVPSEYKNPGNVPGTNPFSRPTSRYQRARQSGASVFDLD